MNSEELSDRFLDYAASIITLVKSLGNSYQGKHISKQLLRSATSCGANYEEARAAESKADFIHKLPRMGAFGTNCIKGTERIKVLDSIN